MKILCPKCFNQITDIKKDKTVCASCGKEFNINGKSSVFRVRLDGGYIKEGMTYSDIVKNIQDGSILADEYIATPNGPWITIYDSPFVGYIPDKGDKKLRKARTAVSLYRQRKIGRITIASLAVLLILSLGVNLFLLVMLKMMQNRIGTLVEKITGGI